ncbi:ABC transporter permease [Thermococci archaeon]|uniref:ABC transporter permease n=1 Tax=Palaeococcus sp. (in: euryarchaeotes) TaxID=2820298 RepID=UPI000F22CE30|nr:ABC transporter permease [Palaeococcus sp. (in: euryarchaeotes)]MCD6559255.1 ABC transporter permease [Palaeococcus sp. (in: euryarchaeotes)]RLF77190.1 MAG: ABC transporter permease [Thermococci archaeon]RLF89052.1 MAG: ABC transporter permease [Thermococci archaeon]
MHPILNIAQKEVYLQLKTKRFYIILTIFVLMAFGGVYLMKWSLSQTPQFEKLYEGASPFQIMFTSSFSSALSNLLPFLGGALGYDIINREIQEGTIKLTLSKPLYRDQFINGKFLGSTITITLGILLFYVLTISLALIFGVPVGMRDITMLLATLPFSLIYTLIFLVIGMLISIFVKKPSTALIVAIILIIFIELVYPMIAGVIAFAMHREELMSATSQMVMVNNTTQYMAPQQGFENYYKTLRRMLYIAPSTHYNSVIGAIFGTKAEISGATLFGGSIFEERSIGESLTLVWQGIVALVVMFLLPFAIAYTKFMKADLR